MLRIDDIVCLITAEAHAYKIIMTYLMEKINF